MSKRFYYNLPTEIYFGEGQIQKLAEFAGKGHRILLVCGRSFLKKSGWLKRIKNLLRGNKVYLFDGVHENPDAKLIEKGAAYARKLKINLMIGVGGGSVLDCAKAISVLAVNKGKAISFLNKAKKLEKRGIRHIAIPTTAGSASEVTLYSVITVKEKGIKITLAHKYLYPDLALIDPDFLKSLPQKYVSNPGVDVLCHAMEAYWNVNSNQISDVFALEAIRLVFQNLPQFYANRAASVSRNNMARASLLAGLAFSNTRTTACHSVSYPLTTIFGIPHGQACALTLAPFLSYNHKVSKNRVMDICRAMGAKTVKEGTRKIQKLMKDIGLKTRLRDLNVQKSDIETIIEKGFTPERMKNNPRRVSKEGLKKILETIY